MQERSLENGNFLLVLGPGEEVHAEIGKLAERRSLSAAAISGIGAVGDLEIGYFCLPQMHYDRKIYQESVEAISLSGNLARLDGRPMCHIHGAFGRRDMAMFGGHVFRAVCSITLELFVTPFPVTIERRRDEHFGIPLLRL
jgi:predicted DNA-binding protein with PD1-like motif